MNGAESLVRTLLASGIDTCFANPGTSEMHFVAALDSHTQMRCVLGLFEGVVTGAADGYFRMADKPAATLLHLGPGLANGLANLHNAKKARSGIVNVVGEHATYHLQHDAPLTSDIAAVAKPMSDWVRTAASAATLANDTALAVQASRTPPGRISTLILPADAAWGEAVGAPESGAAPLAPVARSAVGADAIRSAVTMLRSGEPAALLLGGIGVRERSLELAGRIAAATGCGLVAEYNTPRLRRGAGTVHTDRIPNSVEGALGLLSKYRHLILVGAAVPVAFFATPGKPSVLVPEGCKVTRLAAVGYDIDAALEQLAGELGARTQAPARIAERRSGGLPLGKVTSESVARVLEELLPDDAVVVDEAVTSGRVFHGLTAGAAPHDWLNAMGGSIGFCMPVAVGAAIACPGRKIVALEGDGSGMYTLQALWSMAREQLNVVVVVFANRAYKILKAEMTRMGGSRPGGSADAVLTLDRPDLDWVSLARGHGVEAGRAEDMDTFIREFRRGLAASGPYLIELVI